MTVLDHDAQPAEGADRLVRGVPAAEAVADLRTAFVSRAVDDREINLQKQSQVFFQISGAGHEALLLALARSLRPGVDWFFPYYRDLALVLGLGVSPYDVLLQAVGSADDPSSGGRQMPAHWGAKDRNIVSQSSPTASQCLPAVGCAEAARYLSRRPHLEGTEAHGDELTYVSLGEGATSEGEFWESLNTACTLHLPVLFVVADNGYAISVPTADQAPAPVSELVRGFAGLAVHRLDGTDYWQVRTRGAKAIAQVRAGVGPALLHADVTRPYSHSSADTQSKYRTATELEAEAHRDPLVRMATVLVEEGVLTQAEVEALQAETKDEVAEAARAALAAPRPDPTTVLHDVVRLPAAPAREEEDATREGAAEGEGDAAGEPTFLGEAINRALHEAMEADERIRVFGEDVADAREAVLADLEGKGGVFGTTHGLQRAFGQARCFNTPLAEANIVGRAVGQALRGLRPVPEIQFFDYVWPAMQQLKSEAATLRWRSNGAFTCPMVVRIPIGGYLTGGSIWHSQSGESFFAHVPGLVVVMPSRASDAVGLLRTAFAAEDPVLFLEHKHLLRQPYARDPYPGPDHRVPFGRGVVRRSLRARRRRRGDGTGMTIVTWGATVQRSLDAAEQLAEDGVQVEVLDLRSISPWDQELVGESVRRTGRALVVHEDVRSGGWGGEVAAWIADECFEHLDAPVRRVAALDCHVPYEPKLEDAVLPQVEGIAEAAAALAAF
jgi:2-oxoisovalerate dehydrogenase E1 component